MATPTLTVTDNADGTGGVATLSGGGGGASNAIFVANVNGDIGPLVWTSIGTITGNTTQALSLQPGFYFVMCQSTLAGVTTVTNLVYQNLTSGLDAILESIGLAIVARIQLLTLKDVPADHILWMKVLSDRKRDTPEEGYPLILVVPFGSEQERGGWNVADDIQYPILVVIADKDNQDQNKNRTKYFTWRKKIYAAFRHQRLSGVGGAINDMTVSPQSIVDAGAWLQASTFISSLVITVSSRESRGLS